MLNGFLISSAFFLPLAQSWSESAQCKHLFLYRLFYRMAAQRRLKKVSVNKIQLDVFNQVERLSSFA